jgi:hypothetical protein
VAGHLLAALSTLQLQPYLQLFEFLIQMCYNMQLEAFKAFRLIQVTV